VRGALVAPLLCLPSIACAESTAGQEFSFLSSFFQMIAALAVVIGLILITWHYFNKFTRSAAAGRFAAKHIRLVESRSIAPKKSLLLVEVGGEYLLLSCTADRLTLIKQVNLLEDIEVIPEGRGAEAVFAGIMDRLRS
jgi:flagellar protein FliO/FliZ